MVNLGLFRKRLVWPPCILWLWFGQTGCILRKFKVYPLEKVQGLSAPGNGKGKPRTRIPGGNELFGLWGKFEKDHFAKEWPLSFGHIRRATFATVDFVGERTLGVGGFPEKPIWRVATWWSAN